MIIRDTASILPLTVDNLSFDAGGARLLDGVSFTLARGGITTIIGPNGAGKSLLLRLCHGLLVPSEGHVHWATGDGSIHGIKRHGMVFQRPVMLRRSALGNITHALAAFGIAGHEKSTRASAALAHFGLTDLAQRPARLLSGGEQQRLAIARAWSLSPHVLFLDEPCSQLDPGATRQIEAMLAVLAGEGVTLLLTTHDLPQARRLSKDVLFLNRGKLVESGPASTFFSAPATPEARAYLAGDLLW